MQRDVAGAVRSALAEIDLTGADQGAVALAGRLAAAIDDEQSGRTLAELSRQLLSTLESLGATPAARKVIARGVPTNGSTGGSELDDLRARRATRANRAAAVDAPAT